LGERNGESDNDNDEDVERRQLEDEEEDDEDDGAVSESGEVGNPLELYPPKRIRWLTAGDELSRVVNNLVGECQRAGK